MKNRGPKIAQLTPVVIQGNFQARPEPPDDLTPNQAKIWRDVVAGEDAKFFDTGTLRQLLADYCRRQDAADTLSKIINQFQSDWLKSTAGLRRYTDLLRTRDIEIKGASSLATKLRLTNQSRYTTQSAATAARAAQARVLKPWEL